MTKITSVVGGASAPVSFNVENKQEEWSATVKFDGCVHFYQHYGDDEPDYIHICDVDEMIKALQEIKEMALQVFDGDWPK